MMPSFTRRATLAMTAASCLALATPAFAEGVLTTAQADTKLTEIVNG